MSFESLGHWYDQLVSVIPANTALFVVGNKIDLVDDAIIEDQQAKAWAQAHGGKLFKVSAITGEGLPALFETLGEKVAEKVVAEKVPGGVNIANGDGKAIGEDKKKCRC
jgi:50S ribosomal subunit-associated GTPase HflX